MNHLDFFNQQKVGKGIKLIKKGVEKEDIGEGLQQVILFSSAY